MHANADDRPARASAARELPLLVGIAGHRDLVPEQVPAIRAALVELFTRLRDEFPDLRPALISSLAEGADLLAAEVANELAFPVVVLLPMPRAVCRAELTREADIALFDRVCALADVLEVPPAEGVDPASLAVPGPARDRQFQRAGAIVARYSALLAVVWNGASTDHAAGTARVVEYRRRGVSPREEDELVPRDPLLSAHDNDLVYDIRCARTSDPGAHAPVAVPGFVTHGRTLGRELPASLRATLRRIVEFNEDLRTHGDAIEQHGQRLLPASPYAPPERLLYIDRLFRAADWLGSYYRRRYTRALKARYALWFVMATLLLAFKKNSDGAVGLATIIGVLAIFAAAALLAYWAQRTDWQRKYLDYRALAEGLRVDFYWEIAGVRSQFDGEFAHESFLQKQDADLEWIRVAMRTVSLRLAMQNGRRLASGFERAYSDWVGDDDPVNGTGQLRYYRDRSHTMEKRLERDERVAQVFGYAGIALASAFALDIALAMRGQAVFATGVRGLMLWALALLTVCAGVVEAYVNEKSDRALVRQYEYMHALFGTAARRLRGAEGEPEKLAILRSLGHACLAEHAQWILMHRHKRIERLQL